MDSINKACEELMKKYGHLSLEESLPYLQDGWWKIGKEHDLTGPEVFQHWMDWKSKQTQ